MYIHKCICIIMHTHNAFIRWKYSFIQNGFNIYIHECTPTTENPNVDKANTHRPTTENPNVDKQPDKERNKSNLQFVQKIC